MHPTKLAEARARAQRRLRDTLRDKGGVELAPVRSNARAEVRQLRELEAIAGAVEAALDSKPLSDKTVPELREEAESRGIDATGMRKAEIIEALEG